MQQERYQRAVKLHSENYPLMKKHYCSDREVVPLVGFDFEGYGSHSIAVGKLSSCTVHRQTFYELLFSCTSPFTIEVMGKSHKVNPYDLCIVSTDIDHYVPPCFGGDDIMSVLINRNPPGPYVFLNLVAGCDVLLNFFTDAFRRSGRCNFMHIVDTGDEDIREAMRCLVIDSAEQKKIFQRLVEADLSRLLILIEQRNDLNKLIEVSPDNKLVSAVYTYISKNYTTATLKSAAHDLHYSPDHISAVLRREGFNTFQTNVRRYQLNHALKLLNGSELSVSEIAGIVGFSSYSGFYKAFKQRFAISPGEYLKKYRKTC